MVAQPPYHILSTYTCINHVAIGLHHTYITLEGMTEQLLQEFSIGLRVPSFCGIEDGAVTPLLHSHLQHEV